MLSTVWSVSCLLFFYSRRPRAQPFIKVGARAPVPYGVGATFVKCRSRIFAVYNSEYILVAHALAQIIARPQNH